MLKQTKLIILATECGYYNCIECYPLKPLYIHVWVSVYTEGFIQSTPGEATNQGSLIHRYTHTHTHYLYHVSQLFTNKTIHGGILERERA